MPGVHHLFAGVVLALTAVRTAGAGDVPSGGAVWLHEMFFEEQADGERWLRARYVYEAGAPPFAEAEPDLAWLCNAGALVALAEAGENADRIIVSIAGAALEFGETDPAVPQYFDAFRVENEACVWEGF